MNTHKLHSLKNFEKKRKREGITVYDVAFDGKFRSYAIKRPQLKGMCSKLNFKVKFVK